jgi:uncharacterized membrane protein YdjX (TVP38/TMEM64 family)
MRDFFRSAGFWKWAVAGAALTALIIAARAFPLSESVTEFAEWARNFGTAGALIYGVVFGIVSVLMVPCLPLTIVAGFTFGMFNGLVAVMFGIALGAAVGFLFARYAARGAVAQTIARNAHFNAIDDAIAKDGWKIIGLLRMCPVPFGLTNYLYGLTGVGFWRYMGATLAGMLPGSIAFVYFGAFGKQTLVGGRDPIQYALGGLTLVAMIAVTVMLSRIARRAAGANFVGAEPAAAS